MTRRSIVAVTAVPAGPPGGLRPEQRRYLELLERLAGEPERVVAMTWETIDWLDAAPVALTGPPLIARSPVVRGLRTLGARRFAGRVKDGLFGLWLARHRQAAFVLHGSPAAALLPWLRSHRGPIVWLVGPPEGGAEPAGAGTIAPCDDGVPTASGVTAVRDQLDPLVVPPTAPASEAAVGGYGPLEDRFGIDLLPRLLVALEHRCGRPVPVRWAGAGPRAVLPRQVRHDLRNLRLTDRVELVDAGVDEWLASVAVVVLPWRQPADPELIGLAAAWGRPWLAFGSEDPLGAAVPFPLIEEIGARAGTWLLDEHGRRRLATARGPEVAYRELLRLLREDRG